MDPHVTPSVVIDAGAEITVDASREKVYPAVTGIGEWWPHRCREDSHLALEPWIGGQFFETWGDGGVLHGTVTGIQEGSRLGIAVAPAAEGPPAFLAWSLALVDAGTDGTRIVLAYRAVAAADEHAAAQRAHTDYWERVLDALDRHLQGPANVMPIRRGRAREDNGPHGHAR